MTAALIMLLCTVAVLVVNLLNYRATKQLARMLDEERARRPVIRHSFSDNLFAQADPDRRSPLARPANVNPPPDHPKPPMPHRPPRPIPPVSRQIREDGKDMTGKQ